MSAAGMLILAGFFIFAVFMVARILPPLLALPLMAAWTCWVVQLPFADYLNVVLLGGSMKLSSAMAVVIFGAMFARVIMKTGISGSLIKKAAELAGDQARFIAFLILGAVIFVFLGMSGLGAVIMAGSIALPIMTGAGISGLDAAVILILGINAGLMANIANYGTYIGIFGGETVAVYYLPAVVISVLVAAVYVIINIHSAHKSSASFAGIAKLLFLGILYLPVSLIKTVASFGKTRDTAVFSKKDNLPAAALAAPAVPLLTVYFFSVVYGFGSSGGKVDPVAAAICGFLLASVYATVLTRPQETINILAGSVVEGIRDVAGVIFLFVGIGMLVAAVMHPAVAKVLNPLLTVLVPQSGIGLFVFFALLAPAALYRGPLNMFGMGAGIAVLLSSLKVISPEVLCGIFLSVGFLQAVSDPTNSSNTWISDFVKVDSAIILKRTLPYSWAMCILMLLYVALVKGGL